MAVSGVVVVVLVDYLKAHHIWGWLRLIYGAAALKSPPGLLFAKVMGSGQGGGFVLRPSASHQGLICLFENGQQAQQFMQGEVVRAYAQRAKSIYVAALAITAARGSWDGQTWAPTPAHSLGPYQNAVNATHGVVALTRASIRAAKAVSFWRFAPAAQQDLQHAPGCELAMGLGEAPVLRQCTFSLWNNTESMLNYAHTGAHQQAIQAAYQHDFFSESMFVRMRVLHSEGQWAGVISTAQDAQVAHG
jgi:spheroidene monooxygenase